MKDTTKLGIYFLIGIIMLVVPITYTLTIMANNLKNIDTYEIVLSVDKLIQNLGKIDKLNLNIKNLTNIINPLGFKCQRGDIRELFRYHLKEQTLKKLYLQILIILVEVELLDIFFDTIFHIFHKNLV